MRVLKSLRVFVIIMLALLALQYELGIATNLSPNMKEVPPVGLADLDKVLASVGEAAVLHATLGVLLLATAVAALVLSILAAGPAIIVTGIIAFAGTALAFLNGILFSLGGFKDDGYSHGMATGYLVAFSLYFIQVAIASVKLRQSA